MTRSTVIAIGTLILAVSPGISEAFTNSQAKILIHLGPPTPTGACSRALATPCASAVTQGSTNQGYYAYVLVGDADPVAGVGALVFGITYDTSPFIEWHLCATLDFTQGLFPASGAGIGIVWDTTTRCQRNEPGGPGTGVVTAAGYFYMAAYSPMTLHITPCMTCDSHFLGTQYQGKADVRSCSTVDSYIYDVANPPNPSPLGFARFSNAGNEPGYNPCAGVIPALPTTWSGVKTLER